MQRINIFNFHERVKGDKNALHYFVFEMPNLQCPDLPEHGSYLFFKLNSKKFNTMNILLNNNSLITKVYNVKQYGNTWYKPKNHSNDHIYDICNSISESRKKDHGNRYFKEYNVEELSCCEDIMHYFELRNYIYVCHINGGYANNYYLFFADPINIKDENTYLSNNTYELILKPSQYKSTLNRYMKDNWSIIEKDLREKINKVIDETINNVKVAFNDAINETVEESDLLLDASYQIKIENFDVHIPFMQYSNILSPLNNIKDTIGTTVENKLRSAITDTINNDHKEIHKHYIPAAWKEDEEPPKFTFQQPPQSKPATINKSSYGNYGAASTATNSPWNITTDNDKKDDKKDTSTNGSRWSSSYCSSTNNNDKKDTSTNKDITTFGSRWGNNGIDDDKKDDKYNNNQEKIDK